MKNCDARGVGSHKLVRGCWFPSALLKVKKKGKAGTRRVRRSAREELVSPAMVAEDVKHFKTLSRPALLSLAVGVGQQLTAQLAPLRYANMTTFDQAGHLAVLEDVRSLAELQVDAVATAVGHLHALHRVLLIRLVESIEAVRAHSVSGVRACPGCRISR
jgi:hypothetical protein